MSIDPSVHRLHPTLVEYVCGFDQSTHSTVPLDLREPLSHLTDRWVHFEVAPSCSLMWRPENKLSPQDPIKAKPKVHRFDIHRPGNPLPSTHFVPRENDRSSALPLTVKPPERPTRVRRLSTIDTLCPYLGKASFREPFLSLNAFLIKTNRDEANNSFFSDQVRNKSGLCSDKTLP